MKEAGDVQHNYPSCKKTPWLTRGVNKIIELFLMKLIIVNYNVHVTLLYAKVHSARAGAKFAMQKLLFCTVRNHNLEGLIQMSGTTLRQREERKLLVDQIG